MTHLMHSFYAKLSALFVVLIVTLGMIIAFLCVQSVMMFADEAEQKLNRNLASDLAVRFQPLVQDSIHHRAIRQTIKEMTGINPRIEIYLLGRTGMMKANYLVDSGKQVVQTDLDVEPLNRFISGAEIPILGPDPLNIRRKKPFSAAPIEIMGEKGCYLYVILSSEQYDSAAGMVKNSYIVQTTLAGLGLTLLAAGVIGLVLFGLLTRRLRAMKEVVGAFEQGQLDRRIGITSSDELGQLAASFNQMADTIVANMEDLKRTDRLRRDLIANVSHDLRSPLAAVQGYLETIMIKNDTLSPEKRQEYMDIVLKNTRSLNTLVGELFELSKLDAQQVEPQFEAFSMAELVQDLVMQFQPRAEQLDVSLEADLPKRLSPVYADIGLVERAVSNLIENALRYTPAGGGVRIQPAEEGEAVSVRVIDTGYGIPAEDLPHIFERFYRVEKSRARDKGGTGLGLAIAKKILELHGSTLSVRSVRDKGTTFSFALPVWKKHLTQQPHLRLA
ncbi:MAG: sensor histidine kinase [Rhodothermales bacterium]